MIKTASQIKVIGGARIGSANATWPFVTLTVTKNRLDLNATLIGNYSFAPDDILSIVPCSELFGGGLRINHKVSSYKQNVIFWTSNAQQLLKQIQDLGFLDYDPNHVDPEIKKQISIRQKQGGLAFKWPFLILIAVVWNLLFLVDFYKFYMTDSQGIPLGRGAMMALSFVLISSVLLIFSKDFRRIALKEGRDFNEISKAVYFVMFICGFMLVNLFLFFNFFH